MVISHTHQGSLSSPLSYRTDLLVTCGTLLAVVESTGLTGSVGMVLAHLGEGRGGKEGVKGERRKGRRWRRKEDREMERLQVSTYIQLIQCKLYNTSTYIHTYIHT